MKTLIELFDPRPLENVLSTEVFRPETTVFLCPASAARDARIQRQVRRYLQKRGVETELVFRPVSLFDVSALVPALEDILHTYPDCALDISGGSDAALFAGGMVSAKENIPVFTYSRRKNTFFSIHNAPFAESLPCELQLNVEDCFLMAGAATMEGRVDNGILTQYEALIPDLFSLYLRYRRDWVRIVSYIQRLSQPAKDEKPSLHAAGAYTVRGERGRRISAHEKALRDMQRLGLLTELKIRPQESVTLTFSDMQIRAWLRDVGSILELYTYHACRRTGLFHDVRTSVVVNWDGEQTATQVTNEIDAVAVKGVTPLFISCKTCAVKTDALNELAILRDRFGSEMARAAIVTAERGNSAARQRAQKLGIFVIDIEDLKQGRLQSCLEAAAEETRR